MSRNFSFIILLVLILAGCAITRTARLYPANDAATPGGVIEATFESDGTGHGEVEMQSPDGEIFKGEFSIVREGVVSFGTIFQSVYGAHRSSVIGSGISTDSSMERGSQGTASAFGNKGTRMLCEFYNDNSSGHGYGACSSSKGALYRIQY